MEDSFAKVMSLAAFIVLGHLLRRFNILKDQAFAAISALVMNVTLPCVILTNLNGVRIEGDMLLIAGLGLLTNIIFLVWGLFLSRNIADTQWRDFVRLNVGGYSVGPFAVPYVQSFFPTTGLMATCMFDVGNCVMAGGGTFAVIAGTRVKTTLWRTVKLVVSKLVRSGPLVTFAFVGLMSVLDMRLPDGVITSTAIGAHANTFLCMIMIGESISFSMAGGKMGKVLKLLASRWVVCILIALGVWHFLPFEEEIRMALTLTCLSPIPAMSLVFTAQLDGDIAMAANMSSLSVGCSIIGMSVALMLFGALRRIRNSAPRSGGPLRRAARFRSYLPFSSPFSVPARPHGATRGRLRTRRAPKRCILAT